MDKNEHRVKLFQTTATIASGASLSGAIDLGSLHLCGIVMPASWTAAAITLQASLDGGAFTDLHDAGGSEVSLTVAADRFIRLNPEDFGAFHLIKIRSGTSSTPVNQGADRTLTIVARPIGE